MMDEIVRRREFLQHGLRAAGLVLAPGIVDSAARLEPLDLSGTVGAKVEAVETAVYLRGLEFPTTPAVDALPLLLRDYMAAKEVVGEVRGKLHRRAVSCMSWLASFIAANLADQQERERATDWYLRAQMYAHQAEDQDALAWSYARSALMPYYQHDQRSTIETGVAAASLSRQGQLGSTLGASLIAVASARMDWPEGAHAALDDAERAVETADERQFTAWSCPEYRFRRFASEVYTRLGDTKRASYHQERALAGYPPGAITDPAVIRLDQAHRLHFDGYPREAAEHATDVLTSLAPERRLPPIVARGREVHGLLPDVEEARTLGEVLTELETA